MAFKYYPEFQSPIVQQGEIINYTWVPIGTNTYQTKPEAEAAAQACGYYGHYDMRIIKSSWEVSEILPKT